MVALATFCIESFPTTSQTVAGFKQFAERREVHPATAIVVASENFISLLQVSHFNELIASAAN